MSPTALPSASTTTAKHALAQSLSKAISSLSIQLSVEILLEKPAEADRGDLASPMAMQLIRNLTPEQRTRFRSPLQLATAIVQALKPQLEGELKNFISTVEAVAPGFINFRYSQQLMLQVARQLATNSQTAIANESMSSEGRLVSAPAKVALAQGAATKKRVVIEYVSPNTNKPLHIGHLRNAALGWSLSKLLAAGGVEVSKVVEFNDRGLHIMKSCWGYLAASRQDTTWCEQLCRGKLPDSLIVEIGKTLPTAAPTPLEKEPVVSPSSITNKSVIDKSFADKSSTDKQSPEHFDWQTALVAWQAKPKTWLTPEKMKEPRLRKSDHFIGFWYQLAERFADNAAVTAGWSQMLQCWEDGTDPHHQQLRTLWSTMNAWFYQGFEETRQRFGFGFDDGAVTYESQIYQQGKDLVVAAANRGIFERLPDGAVIARLESEKLPDKILLRRDGTGIYMSFDIELTRQRTTGDAELLVWIVGVDQKLYFQQLFAIAEKLGYGEKQRYFHLPHGMVRLPEGKMSSRKGLVLYADDILELAVSRAKEIMSEAGSKDHLKKGEFDSVAEAVGIGAVKWTMLSVDPLSEITFDIATSVSFKGFAGPYVQYTNARCRSVIRQAKSAVTIDFDTLVNSLIQKKEFQFNDAELAILRTLSTYYETVRHSSDSLASHILCNYLYELCQHFNSFYAVCPIVSDTTLPLETKQFRLLLTTATAAVLKEGLELLGLTAVERM